jgi:heat shock protein HslJ
MIKKLLLLFCLLALLIGSCNTFKNAKTKENLFNTIWELEFISGPRITFESIYPNKKPQITFNTATNEVKGTSSCNSYMAKYTLDGKTISFGEPGPTTKKFCEGVGEQTFLQMIKKVNNYSLDKDGKLNLNIGEVTMMRFKKSTN